MYNDIGSRPSCEATSMTTDTSEKGLETLIVRAMTGTEWIAGNPEDYDREYCVDLARHLGGHVREAVGVAKAAAAVFEKQSR